MDPTRSVSRPVLPVPVSQEWWNRHCSEGSSSPPRSWHSTAMQRGFKGPALLLVTLVGSRVCASRGRLGGDPTHLRLLRQLRSRVDAVCEDSRGEEDGGKVFRS